MGLAYYPCSLDRPPSATFTCVRCGVEEHRQLTKRTFQEGVAKNLEALKLEIAFHADPAAPSPDSTRT